MNKTPRAPQPNELLMDSIINVKLNAHNLFIYARSNGEMFLCAQSIVRSREHKIYIYRYIFIIRNDIALL